MESSPCPTRILDDLPAEHDDFGVDGEVGPHHRIARAIAAILRSPQESGGKMVGLEGGWGAGKTTVLKLLQSELDGDEHTLISIYDAWAHEKDPLRRTFLEDLIAKLRRRDWIDDERWDDQLLRLANRKRTSTTRTVPKTTTLGTWFAFSLLLIPIGAPLLTQGLSDGITFHPGPPAWMFLAGTLLTSFCPLVLLANLVRLLHRKRKGKQDSDGWAFLEGKATTTVQTETVEAPEPTSIEFEGIFRTLMAEALHPDQRKLVLVLDNLDRVDPEDALAIWSTLQTFLQDRSTTTEPWFERLWILVPYDPDGIRRLWDVHKYQAGHPVPNSSTSNGPSSSFLDKSFQLRFRVPPPVLSSWKTYLLQLIGMALPAHAGEDAHKAYRAYNLQRRGPLYNDSRTPTPRELKMFVNELGILHRVWQHSYPIDHLAFYAALLRTKTDMESTLLGGAYLSPAVKSIFGPSLQRSMAGLYFNVHPKLGLELLLERRIIDAFSQKRIDDVTKLLRTHGDGFWVVLENASTEAFIGLEATAIANAAQCLRHLADSSGEHDYEYRETALALSRAATEVESWQPLGENTANGIVALCRIQADPTYSSKLVGSLADSITRKVRADMKEAPVEALVSTLRILTTALSELDHKEAANTQFELPAEPETWVAYCAQLHVDEQGLRIASRVTPTAKIEEIVNHLSTAVSAGNMAPEIAAAVEVTSRGSRRVTWKPLSTACTDRLNAPNNAKGDEAAALLNLLGRLQRLGCKVTDSHRKRLVEEGHLTHCFHHDESQKSPSCTAQILAYFVIYRPSFSPPTATGNSQAGHSRLVEQLSNAEPELAQAMVDLLLTEGRADQVWAIVNARGQVDPLIGEALRILADSVAPESFLSISAVLEDWDLIRTTLDDSATPDRFANLIRRLTSTPAFLEQIMDTSFDVSKAERYCLLVESTDDAAILRWCRSGLDELTEEQWQDALQVGSPALRLLSLLSDRGTKLSITIHLRDALLSYARGILAGSAELAESTFAFREPLFGALDEGTDSPALQHGLFKEAAKRMKSGWADGFVRLFGVLLERSVLAEGPNEAISFMDDLVHGANGPALTWLAGVAEGHRDLLNDLKDAPLTRGLEDRIRNGLSNAEPDEDDSAHALRRIAGAWGIQRLASDPREESTEHTVDSEDATSDGETPGS